jgi:hypothetical protein
MKEELWTLEGALPVIRQVAAIAKGHGFAVALYGSVLNEGQGHDLDLYFIVEQPKTTAVHAQTCVDEIAKTLAEVECCTQVTPMHTSRIKFRDGKHVDAQFVDFTPLALSREQTHPNSTHHSQ